MDVETIKSILWVDFPLYVLTIRDRPGYYLFTTQRHFVSFAFGSKDLSDMGAHIKGYSDNFSKASWRRFSESVLIAHADPTWAALSALLG